MCSLIYFAVIKGKIGGGEGGSRQLLLPYQVSKKKTTLSTGRGVNLFKDFLDLLSKTLALSSCRLNKGGGPFPQREAMKIQ